MANLFHIDRTTNVITLDSLTASRLLGLNATNGLVSLSDMTDYVAGTANEVEVADDGDGTITVGLPNAVTLATSLTCPTIYGSTDGHVFIQPNVGKVNIGSTSEALLGSHSLALVGPNASVLAYPGLNLYTDADAYPLISFLPYAHGNVQLRFESYYDGAGNTEVASYAGGCYRIGAFQYEGNDWLSIDGVLAASQGENMGASPWEKAISYYLGVVKRIVINESGTDTDFIVEGDTDTDLIHTDAANDWVGISEAEPNATLDVNGTTRLGDSDTNYTAVSATGDITFEGSAGFYPVRLSQSAQPTPDTGELIVWRDSDDNKTYLVYNDTDEGVRTVEMT